MFLSLWSHHYRKNGEEKIQAFVYYRLKRSPEAPPAPSSTPPEKVDKGNDKAPNSAQEAPPDNLNIPGYLRIENPRAKHILTLIQAYKELPGRKARDFSPHYFEQDRGYLDLVATSKTIDGLLAEKRRIVDPQDKENLRILKGVIAQTLDEQWKHHNQKGRDVSYTQEDLNQRGANLKQQEALSQAALNSSENWNTKPVYQKLEAAYAQLVEQPEFKVLTRDVMGTLDPNLAGEYKALFLALMEEETEGFTKVPAFQTEEEGVVTPMSFEETMKTMVERFQEAVQFVNEHGKDAYHPAIQRLLIANFYRQSITTKGLEGSDIGNLWVLNQLSQSPFFNNKAIGEKSGKDQREVLEIAFAAGEVARELDGFKKQSAQIDTLLQKPATWQEIQAARYWPDVDFEALKKKKTEPKTFLEEQKKDVDQKIADREASLKIAQGVIQKPYDENKKPNPDLEKIRTGEENLSGHLRPEQLTASDSVLNQIELNQKLIKKEQKDIPAKFERMNMNLNYTYSLYLNELKINPAADISKWEDMMANNPAFLANILDRIIPGPNPHKQGMQAGKADLIATVSSLNNKSTDPQINEYQAIARRQVLEIKTMIKEQEQLMAKSKQAMPIIEKAMEGSPTIKETIMSEIYEIKNQIFSGDAFEMVLGGAKAYLIGALVIGAFKNSGEWYGKLGIASLLAIGVGATYEAKTGKKVWDSLKTAGPDSVQSAAEGTQLLALVNAGRGDMEKIKEEKNEKEVVTEAEHSRALAALNKVPFHKVMEWRAQTENPNPDATLEAKAYAEMGIDEEAIIPSGYNREPAQKRIKFILDSTITQFIRFVGRERSDRSEEEAETLLTDVWVKAANDENFVSHEADVMFPNLYKLFHNNKNALTFGFVMENEVNLHLAKNATMTQPYGQLLAGASYYLGKAYDTTAQAATDVKNWATGGPEEEIPAA